MISKFILVLFLSAGFLFSAQTVNAQTFNEKSDFYLGYQFSTENPKRQVERFDTDTHGGNFGYQYYFNNKPFGLGGEFSADFGSSDTRTITYLGVASLKKRTGRVNPFVAAKFGVSNTSVRNRLAQRVSDASSTYGVGAGLDIKLSPKVSYRLVQIDALRANEFGYGHTVYRLGTGLTF